MNINTPVLLIFFNREKEVMQVLNAIKKCAPKKMYIASDGGRTEKEKRKVLQLRKKVKNNIDWDCQLECLFAENNLGCQWGPISAINWVFSKEERCIILEDDCIPDLSFFSYCDQLLERYKNDERIWMISGENYLHDESMFEKSDYTFSGRTNTWGWATWKRAWIKCDFNLCLWPKYKKENVLIHTYYMKNYDETEYMTKQLDNIYKKLDRSIWDYQWRFHMIINNGLCIVPRKNMISNIGGGKYATHTKSVKSVFLNVSVERLNFPIRHPSCVTVNADFDKKYGEILFWDKVRSYIEKRNVYEALEMILSHYFKIDKRQEKRR